MNAVDIAVVVTVGLAVVGVIVYLSYKKVTSKGGCCDCSECGCTDCGKHKKEK